jgi:hypothetical protein
MENQYKRKWCFYLKGSEDAIQYEKVRKEFETKIQEAVDLLIENSSLFLENPKGKKRQTRLGTSYNENFEPTTDEYYLWTAIRDQHFGSIDHGWHFILHEQLVDHLMKQKKEAA